MATFNVSLNDLSNLIGQKLSVEDLQNVLPNVKVEFGSAEGDTLTLETTHERPDMMSSTGIARAIRGYLGVEEGLPKYSVTAASTELVVDPSVLDVRPLIRCAIVRGVELDEAAVEDMMQLQEKLHEIYCMGRKKASIGVYDLDKVKPPFVYGAFSPKEIRFVPLEFSEELSGEEILSKHPKGVAYAELLAELSNYPILSDSEGRVLSMPPIINSEETKVTLDTRNLFVDVTGFDEKTVNQVLTVMVTSLSERARSLEGVIIKYPEEELSSPVLEYKKTSLRTEYVNRLIGYEFSADEIAKLLSRMRLGASPQRDVVEVAIPPYRFDMLHEIDLVEEVAIALDYNNLDPKLPNISTIGKKHPTEILSDNAREVMVGCGFQEILTYVLCSPELLVSKMNKNSETFLEISNPVSSEYSAMRNSLVPTLLDFLSKNKHYELPQKLFEAGEAVVLKKDEIRTEKHLVGGIIDSKTGYTEIMSVFKALCKNLGFSFKIDETEDESFIAGRVAEISGDIEGKIGEMHPQVLLNFGLEHPVSVFEITLEKS